MNIHTKLEQLSIVPRLLGEPLYPWGFPLKPEQITIEDETLQQKFLNFCERKATYEDEQHLKEYILYYVAAPIWRSDYTEELIEKLLKGFDLKMSLNEMIFECMEYALDPF